MQSARGEAEGKESRRNCFCANRSGVKPAKVSAAFLPRRVCFRPVMTLNCHIGTEDNTILFCDGALWGETPHFSRWKSPGNERETAKSGWRLHKEPEFPFQRRAPGTLSGICSFLLHIFSFPTSSASGEATSIKSFSRCNKVRAIR